MVDFSKLKSRKLDLFDLAGSKTETKIQPYMPFKFNKDALIGLNTGQQEMVMKVTDYLATECSELDFFTIHGGSGVGKSFAINRALLHIPHKRVIAAAPSHFAKNVLKDFLGIDYRVTTVAALLGKKVSFDSDGNEILVRINKNVDPPIVKYKIIIIDEASMIDDDTARELIEYARNYKLKLLVLGDYAQLPPVQQNHDALFFNKISAKLTQPMRFTGYIYDLTMYIRGEIEKIRTGKVPSLNIMNIATDRESKIDETGSGYIFLNSLNTLINSSVKKFKANKAVDYVRIVAYRNKTIDSINNIIRRRLFGDNALQFEQGEIIINNGGWNVGRIPVITNGQVFKIVKASEIEGPYGIPCVQLTLDDPNIEHLIKVVSTEGMAKYDVIEKRLKRIAKADKQYWRDYFSFKATFAWFSYSYAASSHKIQGSSIKHVYVLEDDIMAVKPTTTKQKLQSLYVAISRASFRVYVYNKSFKVNNKNIDTSLLKLDYDSRRDEEDQV